MALSTLAFGKHAGRGMPRGYRGKWIVPGHRFQWHAAHLRPGHDPGGIRPVGNGQPGSVAQRRETFAATGMSTRCGLTFASRFSIRSSFGRGPLRFGSRRVAPSIEDGGAPAAWPLPAVR